MPGRRLYLDVIAPTAIFLALVTLTYAHAGEVREFYIKTVHLDGKTNIHGDANHQPEAFPDTTMPGGGGLILKAPDSKGDWKMRAFAFVPSQIIVHEGDDVRLHFVGVQGASHTIHVEGKAVDERFTLKRGAMKTIDFKAVSAGKIDIECYDHQPAMTSEVIVLPSGT